MPTCTSRILEGRSKGQVGSTAPDKGHDRLAARFSTGLLFFRPKNRRDFCHQDAHSLAPPDLPASPPWSENALIRTPPRGWRLEPVHASSGNSPPESLSLRVPSPALLLNHMADRYGSTSRILMEFVDNSLDDAESLYEPAKEAVAHRPLHPDLAFPIVVRTFSLLGEKGDRLCSLGP